MNVTILIHGLGSVGLFSSRAFLPAFMTALALRMGPEVDMLAATGIFESIEGAPTWFTHNVTLIILGLLSLLEAAATKSPEARELLLEVDSYVKSIMAAVTQAGIISATDAQFVEQVINEAGAGDYLFTAIIVGGVYFMSTVRNGMLQILRTSDEDDDIGIQNLISWAEDMWVILGLLLLIVFPVVMLILIGAVSGVLILIRKAAERREEKSKVACGNCGHMIYPCAVACPKCATAVTAPQAVGFFGQSNKQPATDTADHPYRLVEKKRCPVCATRFEQRSARQKCAACGHELMSEKQFAEAYLARVAGRVPTVCLVGGLLSLIPIVGLIPGVIYYRTMLVAPFRHYIPLGRRFLLKWLIRIVIFLLIAIQWIPIVGGIVVPLMALVNYAGYRTAFAAQALKDG
jgi:hypothetical protein